MVSKIYGFACFWTLWVCCTSAAGGEDHPLCRALASGDHPQPAQFPSAYVCDGGEYNSLCALRTRAHTTEPGTNTWWVYEDRREHVSGQAGNLHADALDARVDCPGYYAFRAIEFDPNETVGVFISRTPEQTIKRLTEIGELEEASEMSAIEERADVSDAETKTSRGLRGSERTMKVVKEDTPGAGVAGTLTSPTDTANRPKINLGPTQDGLVTGQNVRRNLDQQRNGLVYAPNEGCPEFWSLWPAVHDRAISDGTFLMFDIFPSVGNLFLAFESMLKFVRLLELGVVLRWEKFPGFREAFDPADINWGQDPAPFLQNIADIKQGINNPNGLHPLEFGDFSMVLSDPQIELLAKTVGVSGASNEAVAAHFQETFPHWFAEFMAELLRGPMERYEALETRPCAWNMLLRRSPTMMASLEEHSPWGMVMGDAGLHHHPTEYAAWHIRTSEGETDSSYDPNLHPHVLEEPASAVCPAYLAAMEDVTEATQHCQGPHTLGGRDEIVYISSNSKAMSSECSVEAATEGITTGHIDLGISELDAHTWFSTNPSLTALNAFLDYLFLMDSAAIVRTSSSFSGTVASIKGLDCRQKAYDTLPGRVLHLCLPWDCRE